MRLIDADALKQEFPKDTDWDFPVNTNSYVCAIIDSQLTIEPERQKGEWIFVHPLQNDDSGAYMCSECRTGNWEIDPERYFFCPTCGAKMINARGEQDG